MGNPEELNPSSVSLRHRGPTERRGAFPDRKPSTGRSGLVGIPSHTGTEDNEIAQGCIIMHRAPVAESFGSQECPEVISGEDSMYIKSDMIGWNYGRKYGSHPGARGQDTIHDSRTSRPMDESTRRNGMEHLGL
ncbi:hypothetical protein B0H13DRAFT_1891769 [Mycena leptocephala]|nr:hypothetical protein B0H13DRAFT_1891769 [Mycena leptocephala]